MANICIDKNGVPWDILSFKNNFQYKLMTDGKCVCGYCLKPVSFVKESINLATYEPLRSRHFRHINAGDKDFCPYETGESLEHVTVKKNWFLNVLSANSEYLKIPEFSVQTEKTIKTNGRKSKRRFDIGLYDGDNFFAALETEASIKTEYAFQIAERTLDYNCAGAAVDWAFTHDTDPAVASVSLNYTGAYRRTNIVYKKEELLNPDNDNFYTVENKNVIEKTRTLIYYSGDNNPLEVDVEQEALRIEQLIRQASSIKINPDKYYSERKNLLGQCHPTTNLEQHARNDAVEISLSNLIILMPQIISAPRQKIKVGDEFGLMTNIDIERNVAHYIPFRSKQLRTISIDEVIVCNPKIDNCSNFVKGELTPEAVQEYRTAVAEVKQSINEISGTQPTVQPPPPQDISAVVIVDEQVRKLATELEVCSTIEEAYNILAKIDPSERSRICLALPNFTKDKLTRLSAAYLRGVA